MALPPGAITIPSKRAAAQHRLLMFHHACGGAASYHQWAAAFPADIEVWLVELPGRGRSLRERAIETLPELLAFLRLIEPLLPLDYAVFGHSMGALVAYCFALEMMQLGHPPIWFGASGSDAPFFPDRRWTGPGSVPVHRRSDPAIVEHLVSLGGTRQEVVEHEEFRAMLLKLAKADFRLVETFFPLSFATPLPSRLAVFAGREDPTLTPSGQRDWRRASRLPVTFHDFDGGHFYLLESADAVRRAIGLALADARRS